MATNYQKIIEELDEEKLAKLMTDPKCDYCAYEGHPLLCMRQECKVGIETWLRYEDSELTEKKKDIYYQGGKV